MEKRELKEAHCPILKQTSTSTTLFASADPPAQAPPAPEERRVAFDIGDSDDVDNKERKVAFDIGDSDETDYSVTNGGEWTTPSDGGDRFSAGSTLRFSRSPETGSASTQPAEQRLHRRHPSPV